MHGKYSGLNRIKSTNTVQDKANSKVQMTNHDMIFGKSQEDQTKAIEGNKNRIKEMIDEKINHITNYFKPLKKAIQVASNTPNMGLRSMNQYKKSDKINDSDKEYNIEPYQTDTKDTIHTSTKLCTSKINEECYRHKSEYQSICIKETPTLSSQSQLLQQNQCQMLPSEENRKVNKNKQINKASTESTTMKIKNLEDIHEISTKYEHKDKSFEDYDYDVHQCNQAQYEDYQNDSKSSDKNLIKPILHGLLAIH